MMINQTLYTNSGYSVELPDVLVVIAYITNVVKKYLGYIGVFFLFLILSPFLLLFFVIGRKGFNSFAKAIPQIAKETEMANSWQNIDWDQFKKIQYRIELLCSFYGNMDTDISSIQDRFPKFIVDHITNLLVIKESLFAIRKNLRLAHQIHTENPDKNIWNQFDDIWDYETPEEDKKMVYEINTRKPNT